MIIKHIKNYLIFILIFLLSGCSSLPENEIIPASYSSNEKILEVHFLDVGQADCSLIKLPTGESILIDGGNRDDKDYILSYLSKEGVKDIKLVVATHPHEDHIGSLRDVLNNIKVDKIILPTIDADSLVYTNLLYSIEENEVEEVRILGQSSFDIGEATFKILSPIKEYSDKNNSSIVIKMIYGETSFLFTGDIEKEAEKDILETGVDIRADVLKVPHHGSKTSSTEEFLGAVSPQISVIQVGINNEYGMPVDEILERIKTITIGRVYRTDENGEIIIFSDGKSIEAVCGFEEIRDKIVEENNTVNTNVVEEKNYIGNINSKVYHALNCNSLPKEENQISFLGKEEAEKNGYSGHKTCIK